MLKIGIINKVTITKVTITKVISGGQTGADIAGLIAAKMYGIETGGTAPKNYKTENGSNLDLKDIYNLVDKGGYKYRTIKNICDSDGTIVFSLHNGYGGTSKTIGYCSFGKWTNSFITKNDGFRPVLVINKEDMDINNINNTSINILKWLKQNNIKVVNIAGHRQSSAFEKPFYNTPPYNFQNRVIEILKHVFNKN